MKSRRDGDKKGTGQVDTERGSKKTVAVDYDAAVRQIWNNNRASLPAGVKLEQWVAERTRSEFEKLSFSLGAKNDFKTLCKEGCHPYILGLLLSLLRRSPEIQATLATFTGSGKKRDADARRLDESASLIERAFSRLPNEANEVVAGLFSRLGRTTPAQQVSDLRQTAQLVRLGRVLSRRNLTHLSLYLLSSYVEKTTGSPHDAWVSGLIGAVRNNDYDEDAHKKWRARNMEKISQGPIGDWHFAEFLVGLNKLLPPADRRVTNFSQNRP